jgi:NADPH2:quinone reductase
MSRLEEGRMRAAQITALDGPSAVRIVEIDEPTADGRVLVDVHAAGVSFPDVLQTRGRYQLRPDLPFVPGWEVAGVVREAPDDADVRPGDRVAAFPGLGGFAEVVAVDPGLVFPLPGEVSFQAGAALPLNHLTVHFALVRRGQLRAGETVLVHGAAGGVGTAAVQLAAALGARVIAVTSTPDKAEMATAAGAHDTVLADEFLTRVKELTGGDGVDVVVDPVGGDRFTDSLRSLRTEGRLLVIGFTAGDIPTVRVNRLLLNNISVVGVGLAEFWRRQPEYPRVQWTELLPLLRDGRIAPRIGSVHPLSDAAAALAAIDERRATGKVVLAVR